MSFSDLIREWLEANPRRSAAGLSRSSGIPPSTISAILAGRKPSLEVAIRLGLTLPADKVFAIINSIDPGFQAFVERVAFHR